MENQNNEDNHIDAKEIDTTKNRRKNSVNQNRNNIRNAWKKV